ncbi:NAD(P)-dependent dehydrogenase, short-chain alcohol dehydrogenase family [Solimonas aquatica]|uniref:NAD(P)-dependent dehydrogenase, short-chain alcohol dehydrogenase family n=1 Tax=Solimonas aquatica TaxID=489703 RepID=A0A1H9A119_9GAMM|nr:SDR family NAD(P)-dependent oxidoreductase [Solimonas aquatica]SEP70436.1 NAD(P)-dependent dehydrogenase, short-chain alcohol dehydrogenase family [Solimonas aquatica]
MLDAKSYVITGGFGSLGRAVGAAVLAAGGRVALLDQAPDKEAASADDKLLRLGGLDLNQAGAAEAALQRVLARFGRIDGLINIAGTFRWETVEGGSVDSWDLLYRVNLRTALLTSKAALPHLVGAPGQGKRIVNIGAAAAAKAAAGMGAYTASKAGVAKLTEALAEELKDRGVTVNAILPSIIDTAVNRADMPDADFSRWVSPQAIADLIVFLLSPQAEAISGACIPILGRV